MSEKMIAALADLREGMKAVVLALLGVSVILGYAATMVFGVEAVFWVAMGIFPLCVFNMFYWSSRYGC